MSESIRLIIVTDNAEKAGPAIFGMALCHLPRWVLVMTDWQEVGQIEDGTPCMAIWFQKAGLVTLAEHTWRERRQTVKLDDDFQRHFDRVTVWLEKRDAAERKLLKAALKESADAEGVIRLDEIVQAQAAQCAVETSTIKRFPIQSKWT